MSRFHIPRPRSSDGSMLPAVLAAVLACMLVFQLGLTRSDDPELAGLTAIPHGRPAAMPPIVTTVADAVISERPIFTPARASSGGSGSDPLAGAQVSGSWAVGPQVNVVLRQPDGTTRTLRVGQRVNQSVLASVTSSGARFLRDGKIITVPFGSGAPAAAPDAPQKEEESQ